MNKVFHYYYTKKDMGESRFSDSGRNKKNLSGRKEARKYPFSIRRTLATIQPEPPAAPAGLLHGAGGRQHEIRKQGKD